jgi:hypothetical protein
MDRNDGYRAAFERACNPPATNVSSLRPPILLSILQPAPGSSTSAPMSNVSAPALAGGGPTAVNTSTQVRHPQNSLQIP